MGQNVPNISFSDSDYDEFQQTLYQQLDQLKAILSSAEFGQQTHKIGAELELYLIDKDANMSASNQQVLKAVDDAQFQYELNQYNVEINLSAFAIDDQPLHKLKGELQQKLTALADAAKPLGVEALPIGILPTLNHNNLSADLMTPLGRYHCLSRQLINQRGSDFHIKINGKDPLDMHLSNICAEGANTSLQIHLMTDKQRFCRVFNAAQLTLPLVTAISANSPIFLGNQLWDETRVALFKQSIDVRHNKPLIPNKPARVSYGYGWLRHSVWELFAESVALYPPIIPLRDHADTSSSEQLPKLSELCLHMGTLWPWHRPVYDHHGNGHMRIEFRAIASGPSVDDMIANAAFAIGLAEGIADEVDEIISVLPFKYAEYNFYRAAQYGLDAQILWPLEQKYQPQMVAITDVITKLLPIARRGLRQIGISEQEINEFLGIIELRLEIGLTGARWQRHTLDHFLKTQTKSEALQSTVKAYQHNYQSGKHLCQWERPWQ
ncbi:glutamate-cysteine ligase family protein [Thalassotalea ponticola]|uniref:glutamate-cysteine ligase family protein n=1 Tax=Thalassotalea ponticola TaxID=1523392 RepID=UPI0025B4D717|nr:glutamate-cysteine ligase family protein [Thalassotalea ponticola]MDN3651582.1 glutamate-cysteine ligase family protein [Thalassotalea ponticola]